MRKLPCLQRPGAKAISGVAAFVLLSCLGAMAGKEFVMPSAQAARNYPAHDDHIIGASQDAAFERQILRFAVLKRSARRGCCSTQQ